MKGLVKLLAATDLSAPSRHAASRAAMLALVTGANLELLHVVQIDMLDRLRHFMGEQAEAVIQRLIDEAREEVSRLAAKVGEPLGTSPVIHLATGPVVEEIMRVADATSPDLLVLGARGSGFMRHFVLGSTTERLLRRTLWPLLVVKQVAHEPYRQVLVPVDFSAYSPRAIRFALAIAPGANLVLLNVFDIMAEGKMRSVGVKEQAIRRYRADARDEALRGLQQLAQDAGLQQGWFQLLAIQGDPVPQILEQEEEQGADLIVIGKHGMGVVEELLLGSVTRSALAEASCDILVAR